MRSRTAREQLAGADAAGQGLQTEQSMPSHLEQNRDWGCIRLSVREQGGLKLAEQPDEGGFRVHWDLKVKRQITQANGILAKI